MRESTLACEARVDVLAQYGQPLVALAPAHGHSDTPPMSVWSETGTGSKEVMLPSAHKEMNEPLWGSMIKGRWSMRVKRL